MSSISETFCRLMRQAADEQERKARETMEAAAREHARGLELVAPDGCNIAVMRRRGLTWSDEWQGWVDKTGHLVRAGFERFKPGDIITMPDGSLRTVPPRDEAGGETEIGL